MTLRKLFAACCCLSLALTSATAQDKLYPNTFPLGDVKLLDGPFKHACDLNVDVLLQYDVDRLLAPFLKEAGLPKKAEVFPNWSGLDGHVGGHYLSALAIHYAATGNPECKRRMDYMLDEMKRCQDANGNGINNVERTTIYFGRNSINQAYTLNDNFTDAIMVMDDREDELIDVVLGATFKNLKDLHEVSAPGSPIQDFATCQPADQMTDLPAAIAH